MNKSMLSKQIHRKLMLTIHQDGLPDLLAGLIIATFGIIPLLDGTGMNPGVRQVIFLSCYGLEIGAVLWLKRAVTSPRTGSVTLSRKTASSISLILLGINTLIFAVFLLSYLFKWSLWEYFGSFQLSIPLGLVFMILLTSLGAILKAARFYLYGILELAIFMGGEYLFTRGLLENHGIPAASFVAGGLIVISGVYLLFRFLKKYPLDRG